MPSSVPAGTNNRQTRPMLHGALVPSPGRRTRLSITLLPDCNSRIPRSIVPRARPVAAAVAVSLAGGKAVSPGRQIVVEGRIPGHVTLAKLGDPVAVGRVQEVPARMLDAAPRRSGASSLAVSNNRFKRRNRFSTTS